MPMSHNQWRELPPFAILFLRELPQVCDPFFATMAVCAMVVGPWHIAAGTDAETRFLHQWMRYCMDLSFETADF
jgi:hypothetical protein